MAVSNGFDETKVLPALRARKGWKQPSQASFTPVLSSDVTTCLSGLPFNRDHAVCSPAVLYAVQEDEAISDTNFNAYLMDLKDSVIMDSLNTVFSIPQIIEQPKYLFDRAWRTGLRPLPNTGKFCGWMIKAAKGNYAIKIDSIALMMSAPCTVTMYLFNDLRKAPLKTTPITIAAGNDQAIFNVDDWILNNAGDSNKGGYFFVGYFQDELQGQDVTAMDVYLENLNGYNLLSYMGFNTAALPGNDFDRIGWGQQYLTYGINLEISTYYDHTNTIVRNASQFDKLIGLQMIAKCIEEVMFSMQSNRTERMSQEQLDMLYTQLEGAIPAIQNRIPMAVSVPYKSGLRNKIEREIRRITQTFNPTEKLTVTTPLTNNNDSRTGFLS